MIQRIQSVWLLLATGLNAVTFRLPFANGDYIYDKFNAVVDLNATSKIWITVLTILIGLLAFVTIFLFKNRKLQLRLCWLGILLTLGLLAVYFLTRPEYLNGTISIWSVFYFAILPCFILAAQGIRKDEKLIKSLDRLR